MLYDPKWEQKTKPDPLSLESLIAWLEKQPADRQYDYCWSDSCLIAQWLKAGGAKHTSLFSREVSAMFGGRGSEIVRVEPWTFGAALARAREALAG